jgi:hypothetical protein
VKGFREYAYRTHENANYQLHEKQEDVGIYGKPRYRSDFFMGGKIFMVFIRHLSPIYY